MGEAYDVERLSDLLAKATPGPWAHYDEVFRAQLSNRRVTEIQSRSRKPIVNWSGFDGLPPVTARKANANAALMVAAVNALPALLARIAELEQALGPFAEFAGEVLDKFSAESGDLLLLSSPDGQLRFAGISARHFRTARATLERTAGKGVGNG